MKDLKNKNDKELEKMLNEKRKAHRLFRFSFSGSKTKNTKKGRNVRKEIACILTELNVRKRTES